MTEERRGITQLGEEIAAQTGITPEEKGEAGAAQQAAEETIASAARFATTQMLKDRFLKREQKTIEVIALIPPYGERELGEAEESIKNSGIEFRNDVYKDLKPHLLSAMVFASQLGIDQQEVLQALAKHIEEQRKEKAYLRQGITYELASYFVEEFIVGALVRKKHLTVPQSFKPGEERKTFMEGLANSLNDEEKEQLARYIASTGAAFYISPFYFPVSFDVSNKDSLRRQNIAIAITPQELEKARIEEFLAQEGIRKEMFLVAMANPHLRQTMPLGTLLAKDFRVTLQYSPLDKKKVSIKEAIQEQVDRSYTEKPIGSEPKGLLPFEELAGLLVIKGLSKLPDKDLDSEFARIVPEVLQAEQPLSKLEEELPDIRLFFNRREMNELAQATEALKEAVEHPDQVPPIEFWHKVFTKPNETFDYLTTVRDRFIKRIYQEGGKTHLQRWQDVVKSFAVSAGQERNGQPLSLTFLNDHEIVVSDNEGPLFALIKREDGQYYPTSYWDKKTQKPTFGIAGRSYKELKQMIAASPFRYQVEGYYLREVIGGSFSELTTRVYEQIKSQVNLERLNSIGLYPSHAAIASREEGPLRDFQYLIGGMTPYGVVYDSIFSAFVRHLWQHNKLSETDLLIPVPLTGETITVRHPLLDLQRLSFEEIEKRLAATKTDVRIPEITIRRDGGYELRAKAGVYETLPELKKLGFDAVLGRTMANEFNRQAARIYVENALTDLGFWPKDYQQKEKEEQPLALLQSRQQKIYSKVLELGFTVGYKLARSLSLPLTWEREEELWKYLKEELSSEELQKFIEEVGISNLNEYSNTRKVFEIFLNFASGWEWNQYDRSNEFPVYRSVSYQKGRGYGFGTRGLSLGEFAISTQAQERLKVAKKTWEEFITDVEQQPLLKDVSWQQRLSPVLELAKGLVSEIDRMSQAEVTEWAEKIIEGRMAAVGRDIREPIEVKTWDDFYKAVEQLMNTARLVLIYRSEKGRFGWEVSTDKEEIS